MKLIMTLLTLIIYSCNKNFPTPPSFASEKENSANAILKKAAIKLKAEKGLSPCGSGGQMMDEIEMLALSFDYYKELDIDEARKLLVSASSEFISIINSDEQIRPYLGNYPFQIENIEIRIFLQKPNGSSFPSEDLSVISAIDGNLNYEINHKETNRLTTIYKETYQEAIEKLAQQKSPEAA